MATKREHLTRKRLAQHLEEGATVELDGDEIRLENRQQQNENQYADPRVENSSHSAHNQNIVTQQNRTRTPTQSRTSSAIKNFRNSIASLARSFTEIVQPNDALDTDEVSIDEDDMINGSEVPIDELNENDYLDEQMDCAEQIVDKGAGNYGLNRIQNAGNRGNRNDGHRENTRGIVQRAPQGQKVPQNPNNPRNIPNFGQNSRAPPVMGHAQQQFNFQTRATSTRMQFVPPQPEPEITRLEMALILDKIPDLFGNEGSDKLRAFFRRFDLNTEGWPEPQRIRALQSKTDGKAERAFNTAMASENLSAKMTLRNVKYNNVKSEIIQILEELDAKEVAAFDQLFSGLHRKVSEPIDDFADRVAGVVRRAYPGLNQQLTDEYAIKHFLRALDDPDLATSLELARTPGMQFDQLVTLAARAESTRKTTRRTENMEFGRKQQIQEVTHGMQPNRFQSSSSYYPANRSQMQHPNTNMHQRQVPTCFRCNKSGHISRNCNEISAPNQFVNNRNVTGGNPNRNSYMQTPQQKPGPNTFPQRQDNSYRPPYFPRNQGNGEEKNRSAHCIQVDEAAKDKELLAAGMCSGRLFKNQKPEIRILVA